MKEREPVPAFILHDGCINCPTCHENKKRHGNDYGGFDHELMTSCILEGCESWGHSLMHPFITPNEMRRLCQGLDDDKRKKIERQADILEKELAIAAWVVREK